MLILQYIFRTHNTGIVCREFELQCFHWTSKLDALRCLLTDKEDKDSCSGRVETASYKVWIFMKVNIDTFFLRSCHNTLGGTNTHEAKLF